MLHKEIPFLRTGLPLCLGIISGLYIKPDTIFLLSAAIIIATGFSISLLYNRSLLNLIFGYSMTISLFICGLLLYCNEKSNISILKTEDSHFACTVSDFPEEKENSLRLNVNLDSKIIKNGYEPLEGSMILYLRKDSSTTVLLPGDHIIVRCTPVEIQNRGNPSEFNYSFYMQNRGIRYFAFVNNQDIKGHFIPEHRKIAHKALIIRDRIITMYKERGITGERLAVVAAITLGQKNMLDPEQKESFIKAGVMHIMAVSGLHTVILSLFVINLLFFLKGRFNVFRIIITLAILWSFAFVTGLTSSVLRATLMFSFMQAGKLMKRKVNSINSVLASAFVLIIIKPSVIFNAGFLLSYSAVIYIIAFYRELYEKLQFKNLIMDKIWQAAAVTITAQAGTFPLTIMLFNRFPAYFLFINILIVPLSSLLIVTGCLVLMVFPVEVLSQFLGFILNQLTGLTELLTLKISSLPFSSIENLGMTSAECIILSVTIFTISYFLLKKQTIPAVYPLALLTLYFLAGTIKDISIRATNELIVYNTPGSSTIGIRTGKILNLYSDTTGAATAVAKHCSTLGLKLNTNTLKNKYYRIRTGETKILITNSLNQTRLSNFDPDIVILTGLKPEIKNDYTPVKYANKVVIATESLPGFRFSHLMKFTGSGEFYFVRKSGAYTRRL